MSVMLAIYLLEDSPEENGPKAGTILRAVKCSENVAHLQAKVGQGALEVERGTIFSDVTHRVDLTTLQLVTKE